MRLNLSIKALLLAVSGTTFNGMTLPCSAISQPLLCTGQKI
jgi:hypothetical protein